MEKYRGRMYVVAGNNANAVCVVGILPNKGAGRLMQFCKAMAGQLLIVLSAVNLLIDVVSVN